MLIRTGEQTVRWPVTTCFVVVVVVVCFCFVLFCFLVLFFA